MGFELDDCYLAYLSGVIGTMLNARWCIICFQKVLGLKGLHMLSR